MVKELFNINSVAVIGASGNPHKLGYTVVKNLVDYRFNGPIYPVSLHAQTILGIQTYPTITDIPKHVDLAIISVPSVAVPQALRECVQKEVALVVIISAGFKEIGGAGIELEQQLLEIIAGSKTRILGPNCLGLIDAGSNLNASFAANSPKYDAISFISQSGALGTAFLDWISANNLGLHYFVSIGNKADLDENFFLERMQSDRLVACYLEDIKDGKQFMQIGQKYNARRPALILKPGRSAAASAAISSHTGALAGGYEVVRTALQQCGYIVVDTVGELFNTLKAFAWQPLPTFDKVAIVSNAGGAAVIATDVLMEDGLELANLSTHTVDTLSNALPRTVSIHNPVDVVGDALSGRYLRAMEAVLQEEDVSAMIVILTPQVMTEIEETAAYIGEMQKYGKPILASFIGGTLVEKGLKLLAEKKIPAYHFPETAVNVLAHMVWYAEYRKRASYNQNQPVATAGASPYAEEHKEAIFALYQQARAVQAPALPPESADELARRYGIPVPESYACRSVDQAVMCLRSSIGYPCVLKIAAPSLLHKSDIGGVITNVKDEVALREGYLQLEEIIRQQQIPEATILVQQQVGQGIPLIIGATRDANFGTVLIFGSGGIYAEILHDISRRIAPVESHELQKMLEETRVYTILKGARGQKAANMKAIMQVIKAVEYLMQDYDFIQSIDINPLMIDAQGMCAVDVKVVLA
ncbi:acyl-CoA synthetase [Dictyobacter alpinus]|uniref:Acyl-CoA synthetase n=1 Tax=Dictyobacter alpinus TaxID=2014873 RepID=A0A402BGC8_9CHLR|nr:acetate--CoA ligase [Dictyobacter alpinus]GCE30464.1 acyl-CoA synthetase [Dictyobacter alpinus]